MAKKRKKKAVKKKVVRSKPKKAAVLCRTCKLSPRAFGLACGILWGLMILLVGLAATFWSYGTAFANLFATLYPGYALGVQGSIIGGLWGLVDGFICGVLIAWLYNRFV